MKIIGLTGGIGTGKSTVSAFLAERGLTVVDADKIAHQITQPGQKTLAKLAEAFGSDIILDGDILDRKALAAIAFSCRENTAKLDVITHGAIKEEMTRQLDEARLRGERVAVLDVPLLIETGMQSMCDFVWVVVADRDVRYSRISARDGMTHEEISARMEKQLSDEERNRHADELIDNSGGKEELYVQLERLLEKYA